MNLGWSVFLFTLDFIHQFPLLFSHVFVVPCISLLKDRESNLEEEFPTLEANNNTDEVEEPTENTGEMNNNFVVKGFVYQRLEGGKWK